MSISVFRKEQFNAAHRLHNSKWSDKKNKEVFGVCNRPNYHGHNYELIVKLTGEIDPETGYLIDLKVLKKVIREKVIDRFDHKNLNLDIEEFKDLNPTAENIAVTIWNILRPELENKFALTVRLYETPRNFVEYNGK